MRKIILLACVINTLWWWEGAALASSSPTSSTTRLRQATWLHDPRQGQGQSQQSMLTKRLNALDEASSRPFSIVFYKPTYILPFYHTGSPNNAVYLQGTSGYSSLDHTEIKYQFSFMVPAWRHLLGTNNSLYMAYTQLSYWQAYNRKGSRQAFFRSTDYEPELFLVHPVHYNLTRQIELSMINLGIEHQSNGFGDVLERSWNRMYLAMLFSSDRWLFIIKPWLILRNTTYNKQNPDMAKFLGHEQMIVAYQYGGHVFSVEARNVIEHAAKRIGLIGGWSFPLTNVLQGYVQVFHGYGQSLLEYNHRTTSFGIGISLNNFM